MTNAADPPLGEVEREALVSRIKWNLDHFGPTRDDGEPYSRFESPAHAAADAVYDFLAARAHQPTPPRGFCRAPGCGHLLSVHDADGCHGQNADQAANFDSFGRRGLSGAACTCTAATPTKRCTDERVALTDNERLAISAVVHKNYYMPDVFAAVCQIIANRALGCVYDRRGLCTRHGSPTRHVLVSTPTVEWPPCLSIDPPLDHQRTLTARAHQPTPPEQAEAVAVLDEVERLAEQPDRHLQIIGADIAIKAIVAEVRAALTPTAATQVSAALAVAQAAADKARGSGGT